MQSTHYRYSVDLNSILLVVFSLQLKAKFVYASTLLAQTQKVTEYICDAADANLYIRLCFQTFFC